jgi:hypothetical protein
MPFMHKNSPSSGLTNPAAAAETAVYTTPFMPVGVGQSPVDISGTINITPGTAATGATVRLRQGSGVGGTQIGSSPLHTVVAGSPQSVSFGFTDASTFLQAAGGGQYTLTLQMTAATGVTTVNSVDIGVSE